MKVRVRKSDIDEGRRDAGSTCGCPIHRALARKLKVPPPYHDGGVVLRVPNIHHAKLGRIKIPLPIEAVVFQRALMADPDAKVRPFVFETELVVPR